MSDTPTPADIAALLGRAQAPGNAPGAASAPEQIQPQETETSDSAAEASETPGEQPKAQQEQKQAPWTAENFNPEVAWQLVQNLRQEVADLKHTRKAARQDSDQDQSGDQTHPAQQDATQTDAAQEKDAQLNDLTQQLHKVTALSQAGLPLDLAELIPGGDERQINDAVTRLKGLTQAQQSTGRKAPAPDPAQAAAPAVDPREALAAQFFGSL